ncbi:MAG: lysophospholipase [Proteobacteria bacterium]|nr:lysophospholipase [Pseudomonadota bacterium]
MSVVEGRLDFRHSAARGTSRLYRRSWLPDGDARAAVLLVHGLGEHCGRYGHLAAHCNARGFAVHAIDHYGHGKSDGRAGYVERFSVYLDGVRALRDAVRTEQPKIPMFLLGHSMGGLIAAALLVHEQADFRGCVLSGPALRTDEEPPALVRGLIRLISWLLPTVPVIGLDPSGVSRDPAVVGAYVADPLVHHGKLSARLIAELGKAMRSTRAAAHVVDLPLLILHGEEDALTSPGGSAEFYEHAGSTDKTLKTYPGLHHEIFNEPEKDAVLADMTSWLEAHLQGRRNRRVNIRLDD